MKVSIITAVFNSRETIQDALETVAAQTYADIEHIVIDGASKDGTMEILGRFESQLDILISEPDVGIYDALNKGVRLASGEVVGFLHADDLFVHDGVVARIAETFEDASVEAVYGDVDYVSRRDPRRVIRRWRAGYYLRKKLAWGWMPPHPTFYVRRGVYERLGAFDTGYRIAADYDCILRFLGRGGIIPTYIPEVLVKMRVGGVSNRTLSNILRKSSEDYRALRGNEIGGIGALAWKNMSKLRQFFV